MASDPLEKYRQQLDAIDNEIVANILKRFKVCEDIGKYKKQHDIPMMQPHRVEFVKQKAARLAADSNLKPEFMQALYGLIIEEACELQNKIINQ